mmetsp:Transcript_43746/g.98694  ORF Transcript_43746/g.98694 Transcript_43746/m.98694 type:complete len:332 (-) Transcript_43746:74-1069(-)
MAKSYSTFMLIGAALCLCTLVDLVFSWEPASAMARRELFASITSTVHSYRVILEGNPIDMRNSDVEKFLAKAELLSSEAASEFRWHLAPFKKELFSRICTNMRKLHLDLVTLRTALLGSDDVPDDLFHRISDIPAFHVMKEDVLETLEDMQMVVMAVVEHETDGPISADIIQVLQNRTGITKLDGLDDILNHAKCLHSSRRSSWRCLIPTVAGKADGFEVHLENEFLSASFAEEMPATDILACKFTCRKNGFGGFVVRDGTAYFHNDTAEVLLANMHEASGATLFVDVAAKVIIEDTMEDDEVTRLCVAFEMLDSVIEHVTHILMDTLENM